MEALLQEQVIKKTLKGFEVEMFCLFYLNKHEKFYIVSVTLRLNEKNLTDKAFLDTRLDLIGKNTLHFVANVQIHR